MSGEPASETGGGGPFADLLFTLVATVMPAVLLLLPALQSPEAAGPPAATPAALGLSDGTPAYLARRGGLLPAGEGARLVPLDAIPEDAGLRARLSSERGAVPLLVVEPEGSEAAFLFEGAASRAGLARIRQIRLERACTPPDSCGFREAR